MATAHETRTWTASNATRRSPIGPSQICATLICAKARRNVVYCGVPCGVLVGCAIASTLARPSSSQLAPCESKFSSSALPGGGTGFPVQILTTEAWRW